MFRILGGGQIKIKQTYQERTFDFYLSINSIVETGTHTKKRGESEKPYE